MTTRPMYLRPALIPVACAIACLAGPSTAAAQSDQVRTYLQRKHPGCEIKLSPQPMPSGHVKGTDKVVTVAHYLMQGCGGGNDWSSSFAAFNDENGRLTELDPPAPVPGQVDDLRLAGKVIVVKAHEYKPADAHCCPSKAVTYRFVVHGDRLVPAR